jgi:hypothetical protein
LARASEEELARVPSVCRSDRPTGSNLANPDPRALFETGGLALEGGGKPARGSWLVIATAMTVPERTSLGIGGIRSRKLAEISVPA